MNYIIFERRDSKFSRSSLERSPSAEACSSVSWDKIATIQHKNFCVREFIKTESATAVQRAFRLRFNIQPPTRKYTCRWNHQFEQIGCLCKGKSSGRPRVPEENVRRIQESFERAHASQSIGRAKNLGYRNRLAWVEAPFTVQAIPPTAETGSLSPSFLINL